MNKNEVLAMAKKEKEAKKPFSVKLEQGTINLIKDNVWLLESQTGEKMSDAVAIKIGQELLNEKLKGE